MCILEYRTVYCFKGKFFKQYDKNTRSFNTYIRIRVLKTLNLFYSPHTDTYTHMHTMKLLFSTVRVEKNFSSVFVNHRLRAEFASGSGPVLMFLKLLNTSQSLMRSLLMIISERFQVYVYICVNKMNIICTNNPYSF